MDDKKKFKGLYVEVRQEGDKDVNLEYALRKLKQMIKNDDLMVRIHETSYFTKPSEKKRTQRAQAKARARSQTRRSNL